MAAWLRRAPAAMALLVIAAIVLASLDNAITPSVQLAHAGAAPPSPAIVHTLAADARTGVVLAGTSAGVFRSYDGGDTWQPSSNGLTSIDIQTFAPDYAGGRWFAAAFAGNVFRSADGGRTWQFAGRGLRPGEIMAVAYDSQTGTLYAGLRGYGLYRSKDGGTAWETVGFGLSNMLIHALLAGSKPAELFAATDFGVYYTPDLGATWTDLTAALPALNASVLMADPRQDGLYAGTSRGILRITADGAGFTATPAGLDGLNVQSLAIDPASGALYAGTQGDGIFSSADGGAHWTAMNDGLRCTLVGALLAGARDGAFSLLAGTDSGLFRYDAAASRWRDIPGTPQARTILSLVTDPRDGAIHAGTRGGAFASVDGGATWQPAGAGLDNPNVQALGLDTGASVLYAGTPQGVYFARPIQADWGRTGAALRDVNAQALAVDDRNGVAYLVSDMGDTYRSFNGGETWQLIEPLQPVFVRTIAYSAYRTAAYVGAYRGGVRVSYDKGQNWGLIDAGLDDRNVEALAVDERNGALYAGTLGGAIYRAAGDGASWRRLGPPLPNPIVALAVDEQTDAVVAATKTGVYRLPAGQAAWQPAMSGLPGAIAYALAAARPATLYAGLQGAGLSRSGDGGRNWLPAGAGLSDAELGSLTAHPAGTLYASATGMGILRSDDGGGAWLPASAGLHSLDVRSVALDLRDESVWLVAADGVYQSVDGAASWQRTSPGIPPLLDLILPFATFGYAGRLPSGQMIWAVSGGGALWAQMAAGLGLNSAAVQSLPDGTGRLSAAWGADVQRSEPGPGYGRIPLGWLWFRIVVWRGTNWLNTQAPWWWAVPATLALLAGLLLLARRIRLAWRLGVPLGRALLQPGRMALYARPQALDKAWAAWEPAVQSTLFRHGIVEPGDLPGIPRPLRMYALQRYADQHTPDQLIELRGRRLETPAIAPVRRWDSAWSAIADSLKKPSAGWLKRERVDDLAAALSTALDVTIGLPRDVDMVRAYVVHGQAPQPLPPHLAFLFVADSEPSARTIKSLARTLDGFKLEGAVGLVIPLTSRKRQKDAPNRMRAVLSKSDDAGRLIVLDSAGAMNTLISRRPAEAVARLISHR